MKNNRIKVEKRNFALLCLVLLLLLTVPFFASGCETGGYPIIENQRGHAVRIFVTLISVNGAPKFPDDTTDYGVVPARTTKELAGIVFVRSYWVYRIEARDPSGKIVFSQDYNLNDLKKIRWKIVIPQ